MTESLAEFMATRPTEKQRAEAEAAIDKLTADEQRRMLVEAYAVATEHGDDPDRMIRLGRDIKGTVRLRGIPGYREMVDASRQPTAWPLDPPNR